MGGFALDPKTGRSARHGVNGAVTGRGSLRTKGHDQEEQGSLPEGGGKRCAGAGVGLRWNSALSLQTSHLTSLGLTFLVCSRESGRFSHSLWMNAFECVDRSGEPLRAGWAGLGPQPVLLAPQQIGIPATAAAWGPGSPCHCAEGTGDKGGQRPARSGGKAEAGCEQAPGDGDLMMQNLMTQSLWGRGLPWRRREVQPPAVGSTDLLPRQGQLPHRVQV